MPAFVRELEVVLLAAMAEHHAVEAIVIGEGINYLEAESIAVEAQDLVPGVGGTRDTQMYTGFHHSPFPQVSA
jgi:hypothetical protein